MMNFDLASFIIVMSYLGLLVIVFVFYHVKNRQAEQLEMERNRSRRKNKNRSYSTPSYADRPSRIRISSGRSYSVPSGSRDTPLQRRNNITGRPRLDTITEETLTARLNEVFKGQIRRQRLIRI